MISLVLSQCLALWPERSMMNMLSNDTDSMSVESQCHGRPMAGKASARGDVPEGSEASGADRERDDIFLTFCHY
ncbi:hypothetical protein CR157_18435 [Halomonas sp. LBP4]|nr:hypothetical protein CR157_18435 [Halomonas sp. LBP4]